MREFPDHAPQSALRLSNLTRRFGDCVAVDNISFEVEMGEIFGMVGPTGSGKTTTARMLSTLLSPSHGEATVLGFDLRRQAHCIRPRIGVIFQEPALDESLTVEENLLLHLAMRGVRRAERRARIDEVLTRVGLDGDRERRGATLSWGMKRRLELSRACSSHPQLLLLDEPTHGLDAPMRRRVVDVLDTFRHQPDHAVFVCTHDPDLIAACDRVALLRDGHLLTVASAATFRRRGAERRVTLMAAPPEAENVDAIRLCLEGMKLHPTILDGKAAISGPCFTGWLPRALELLGDRVDGVMASPPSFSDVIDELLQEGGSFADAGRTPDASGEFSAE